MSNDPSSGNCEVGIYFAGLPADAVGCEGWGFKGSGVRGLGV